jgi:hypothetical protein
MSAQVLGDDGLQGRCGRLGQSSPPFLVGRLLCNESQVKSLGADFEWELNKMRKILILKRFLAFTVLLKYVKLVFCNLN